jgi:hypothetical protein
MKNTFRLIEAMRSIAIIAIAIVIGFSFATCDNGTGGGDDGTPQTSNTMYTWDDNDYNYSLAITGTDGRAVKSGGYVLVIYYKSDGSSAGTSTGTATGGASGTITFAPAKGTSFTLTITGGGNSVTIEVSQDITITFDDNKQLTVPKGKHRGSETTTSGGAPAVAAAQLAAEFNAIKAGIAEARGAKVTLTGGIFFQWWGDGVIGVNDKPFEVPEGVWISGKNRRLIVPAGVTLDVTADGAALGLGDMTLTVNGTVNSRAGSVRFEDCGSWITINGNGIIYLKGTGSLFWTIQKNKNVDYQKLTIDGVTLVGVANNDSSLIRIGDSGEFVLKSGRITGNTTSSGGGVDVNNNGTLTMTGGEISGNTAASNGGGVKLGEGSNFTMSGGAIYGNTGSDGAVFISKGTFTMTGGAIYGNTANSPGNNGAGGGVHLTEGTFTMSGGEIYGNTATGNGGGVFVWENSTFTMSGGAIYGNTAYSGGGVCVNGQNGNYGTFIMSGGRIQGSTDSDGFTKNIAQMVHAALSINKLCTAKWGMGGTYTMGGVNQTGGSAIVGGSDEYIGTNDTLIAR